MAEDDNSKLYRNNREADAFIHSDGKGRIDDFDTDTLNTVWDMFHKGEVQRGEHINGDNVFSFRRLMLEFTLFFVEKHQVGVWVNDVIPLASKDRFDSLYRVAETFSEVLFDNDLRNETSPVRDVNLDNNTPDLNNTSNVVWLEHIDENGLKYLKGNIGNFADAWYEIHMSYSFKVGENMYAKLYSHASALLDAINSKTR